MDFYLLQVSLLPRNDELFKEEELKRDIRHFEIALDSSSELLESYSIKVRVYDPDSGVMAGVVSKKSEVNLHDREFKSHQEDNFPPVLWMWDRYEQVILVERKTSVFPKAQAAAKAFDKISNNIYLAEHQLRSHIFPKLTDNSFWDSYDSLQYITTVEFDLATPNLFGNTKEELGGFLKEISNETNASEFKPVFKNKDGFLNLRNSKWVKILVDWTKDGGGSWSIWGRRNDNEKPKKIESKRTAKILTVDGDITEVELEGYSADDVKGIIEVVREQYTFRR